LAHEEIDDGRGAAAPFGGVAREPWTRPSLRVLPVGSSETGTNSNTDATVTFS
jgi:hypothetical protein